MPLSSSLTVTLQVAFTTNPGDVPTWTTVASNTTKKLRSWKIDRGRSAIFDQFPAGKATFVLDNRDRTFDPLYTAGTYYGQMLPMKRVRLQVTFSGTTYTRFDGFVNGWPQSYLANGKDAVVQLDATDAFKWLARKRVRSVWEQVVAADTPLSWYRLGESSGTAAADSSSNKYTAVYEGGATYDTRSGLIANDADNAIGFDGVDNDVVLPAASQPTGDTTVEMWFSMSAVAGDDQVLWEHTSTSGAYTTLAVSGTSGSAGTIFVQQAGGPAPAAVRLGSVRVDDDQVHHLVLTLSATAVRVTVDGTLDINGAPFGIQLQAASQAVLGYGNGGYTAAVIAGNGRFKGTLDEVAAYSGVLSDARIAAHYAAGRSPWNGDLSGARTTAVLDAITWPAADRNISTGSAVLGPAALQTDALSHLQAVTDSEGGRLFISRDGKVTLIGRADFWSTAVYNTSQATFGDGGGSELPYSDLQLDYGDLRVRNDVTVNPATGSIVNRQDAASQATYGPISLEVATLESRPAFVESQAEWLLSKLKDAAPEVTSISVDPERSLTALFPVLLGAELGYRYTVVRRPQGVGSAITQEVQLEGTSESGNADRYTFSWSLSPGEPAVWLWGTSTWQTGSKPTRWGY